VPVSASAPWRRKNLPEYQCTHFHPSDTSGVLLSLDTTFAPKGTDPALWWPPAEKNWLKHAHSDVIMDCAGVEIQAENPDAAAALWSKLLNRPAQDDIIRLDDDGEIRFTPIVDGRGPGVSAYDVKTVDERVLAAAEARQKRRSRAGPRSAAAGSTCMKPLLIVGSYLSPYVRKVLVCLELKAIVEIDHIVPSSATTGSQAEPAAAHPVLVDGDLVLTDSTVICEYIEDKQPTPALLPATSAIVRERAGWRSSPTRAWATSSSGGCSTRSPSGSSVWGEKGDRALVDRTLRRTCRGARLSRKQRRRLTVFASAICRPVTSRRPVSSVTPAGCACRSIRRAGRARRVGWRTRATPAFAKLSKIEDASLRTPIAEQRNALKALGAPVSTETYAASAPRRGIVPI
jgi:hypothetical protein